MARAPVFFVVGCPRSGTTLISRILDGHSRIAVYHESQYYPVFHSLRRWYGDLGNRQRRAGLIGDVRRLTRLQGVEPPSIESFEAALVRPTFEGVLEALLTLDAERQSKSLCGDKTPGHFRFLPEILAGFPGSTVLFVVRDPRDTVRSMMRTFRTPLGSAVAAWNEAWQRLCEAEADRRIHVVRYEDLVAAPEAAITAMCTALGERYEEGMLGFADRLPERISSRQHLAKLGDRIDTASVGRFRELPAAQIAQIEAACRLGMEALGYATSDVTPSATKPASPGLVGRLWERVRYYGLNPERWRRGWFRWDLQGRVRLRSLGRKPVS